MPYSANLAHKVYIAQVPMSPQSVLDKSASLQNAMNWGLGISSFFFSLFMMAAFVRFILNTGNHK